MWFCRSVGHDLAMIFQFPAQHIKATSQTRINLINLYCSCHSDGSSFPSSSFCLTSAISASISRVLWEGTQVYPEEVKGERVEKASDSLEAFPCSWLFLVVYSPNHLLSPVHFLWSNFSHDFILLFETLERKLLFKLRSLAKPCLSGVRKCLVGLCQKTEIPMKLNLEVLPMYQTDF